MSQLSGRRLRLSSRLNSRYRERFRLFRIESESLELTHPFRRRIAEPLDTDAAGQATFYCCFDTFGREEGKRDRHIDLQNAAFLAHAKFGVDGYSTGDDIVEPPAAFGDGADQAYATIELLRVAVSPRCVMWQ
jgi:hypothetical protein